MDGTRMKHAKQNEPEKKKRQNLTGRTYIKKSKERYKLKIK